MEIRTCLPPIIDSDSEILILGTFPGKDSLMKNEYYANQDNIFWDVVYRVFNPPIESGCLLELSYQEKTRLILSNNIALWDVLKSCLREGNRDSKIVDWQVNDFIGFFKDYPNIKAIVFNGENASKYFQARYSENTFKDFKFKKFFSTSPSSPVNAFYILYEWNELKKLKSDL